LKGQAKAVEHLDAFFRTGNYSNCPIIVAASCLFDSSKSSKVTFYRGLTTVDNN
jgi:hypothetical protein